MGKTNVVLYENGPILGDQIIRAWHQRTLLSTSQSDDCLLLTNVPLDVLVQSSPALVILVTDSPSAEFENAVLEVCRAHHIRVLPVLGRASTVLIGPLERPGVPGCVTCLKLRWEHSVRRTRLNRLFQENFKKTGKIGDPNMPLSTSEALLPALGTAVVDEAHSIVRQSIPRTAGHVGIFGREVPIDWAPLVPSSACPRCNLRPDDHPDMGKIVFQSHIVEDMNRLRVRNVDFEHLRSLYVNRDIGYVSSEHELWSDDQYVRASALIQMPLKSCEVGYGSGFTAVEAKQKAMLEVLERTSAIESTNRRPVVWESFESLRGSAVHPKQFGFHDASLYAASAHYLEPFDEVRQYSWIWAYSTRDERPVLIPEQIAFYGPTRDEKRFVKESSSGCALGGTTEEAVIHGICEVLERDGFLNMWYAKLPVPELQLGSHCPSHVRKVYCMMEKRGYQVRLFDISHDLPIPAVLAVAVSSGNQVPKVVCGSSSHLNPYEATDGALRELMVQVLHLEGISAERRQQGLAMLEDQTKITEILDHVVAAGQPEAFFMWKFLLNPSGKRLIQSIEDAYGNVADQFAFETEDVRDILQSVLGEVHARGFDVLVVNQTNPEVSYGGLHAVKVLVPGMTPITFGYGSRRVQGLSRVLELPRLMGYTDEVISPNDLNDVCHPFA